ncbi:hypothetical protein [Mesorhizobium sp.]|uniref:hypothetical protein n=1 Tax=Mesorhizobium sp. TaxID=1871066 RepID=UPI0025C53235|nr:hypothetical protein [Mesorhizobium sp.]
MDRTDLLRLTNEELIDLVLRMQPPEKRSRTSSKPPSSDRKGQSKAYSGLAEAIVAAFGFDMDHAYGFYSKLTGKLFDSPLRFELFAGIEGSGSRSVKGTRVTTAFQKVGSAMIRLR